MITHSITPYEIPTPAPRKSRESVCFTGPYNTPEHKRFIHSRVLEMNRWKPGDTCCINGAPGVVVDVLENFEEVQWRNLECLCVEVFSYADNDTNLFHPNRLRESIK